MTKPMSTGKLLSELKLAKLDYVPLKGWENHHRPGTFDNLEGVMLHYTAGNYRDARAYAGPGGILWDGRAGLPGPLCQFGIDKDGVIWLTGWGRANHAGRVSSDSLDLLRRGKLSLTNTHRSNSKDNVDGNAIFYGIEMMTASAPTEKQLRAAKELCAIICKVHSWPITRVIGHGEATARKTGDPRGVNMGEFRIMVGNRLKTFNNSGGFQPVNKDPKREDDEMSVMANFYRDVQTWTGFGGANWCKIENESEGGFCFLEGADRNIHASVTGGWTSEVPVTGNLILYRVNAATKGYPVTGEVARTFIEGGRGNFSLSGVIDLNVGHGIRDGLRLVLDTTPTPKMTLDHLSTRVNMFRKG